MITRLRIVKTSPVQESIIAKKLRVDKVRFSEVKYVNTFTVKFVYDVFKGRSTIGTLEVTWSTRKQYVTIIIKRFSDNKMLIAKMLEDQRVYDFFKG